MTNRPTIGTKIKIADRIRQVCKCDESGYAVFEPGHDDHTIAKEFDGVPVGTVKQIRREVVGNRRKRILEPGATSDRVRAIEVELKDLRRCVDLLAASLGVNLRQER